MSGDLDQAGDVDLAGAPYRLYVDGSVVVQPWEEDRRALADSLNEVAAALGLTVRRASTSGLWDAPRKRWSHRAVTLDEVHRCLQDDCGTTLVEMARQLYHDGTTPWDEAATAQAVSKLRVALHKLAKAGCAVKRAEGTWEAVGESR